jgi:CRP-like cAMP-binding protein
LISILGGGEFLGESNLFNGTLSPVSAQPVFDEAVVLTFRREVIKALIAESPAFGLSFLQQMNSRVRRLETLLVETA